MRNLYYCSTLSPLSIRSILKVHVFSKLVWEWWVWWDSVFKRRILNLVRNFNTFHRLFLPSFVVVASTHMSLASALPGNTYSYPDKDTSYEDTMSQEQKNVCTMIGYIAGNIRWSWGEKVTERLDAIRELCEKVEKPDWRQEIDDNEEDIRYDGRWMRNCWSGPYNMNCTKQDIIDLGYEDYVHIFCDISDDE